ncbi:hypothetical protein RIF29_30458 [Crotalaria pallida]|uniref:Uncharacterized protein n=1 Tax=Crotalaria pallida TaxID=3830 RepID=A0AAN9EIB4_CROPI
MKTLVERLKTKSKDASMVETENLSNEENLHSSKQEVEIPKPLTQCKAGEHKKKWVAKVNKIQDQVKGIIEKTTAMSSTSTNPGLSQRKVISVQSEKGKEAAAADDDDDWQIVSSLRAARRGMNLKSGAVTTGPVSPSLKGNG